AGDARTSVWSAIGEIEFYGDRTTVSIDDDELAQHISIYPIPAQDRLHVKNINRVNTIAVYSMDGRKMIEKTIMGSASEASLDVSSIPDGAYIVILKGEGIYQSRRIVILH
ncbi:MAG: T9SS type A sorting domain-containing protein, partial [Bacteroidia bacterium]